MIHPNEEQEDDAKQTENFLLVIVGHYNVKQTVYEPATTKHLLGSFTNERVCLKLPAVTPCEPSVSP